MLEEIEMYGFDREKAEEIARVYVKANVFIAGIMSLSQFCNSLTGGLKLPSLGSLKKEQRRLMEKVKRKEQKEHSWKIPKNQRFPGDQGRRK